MKKILILIVALFSITAMSYSQYNSFTVQGGYSWLNGVVGAELQLGHVGLSGGYMPTKMPGSGERLSSFSGAFTWYGDVMDESCYYTSIGIASAGYRSEVSYNGGSYENGIVKPMGIWMLGYKYAGGTGWSSKIGGGVGWCSEATVFTFEITLAYSFIL